MNDTQPIAVVSFPFPYDMSARIARGLTAGLVAAGAPARHIPAHDGTELMQAIQGGLRAVLFVSANLFCPGNEHYADALDAIGVPLWVYSTDAYYRELSWFPTLPRFVRGCHDRPDRRYIAFQGGDLVELGEVFAPGTPVVPQAGVHGPGDEPPERPRRRLLLVGRLAPTHAGDAAEPSLHQALHPVAAAGLGATGAARVEELLLGAQVPGTVTALARVLGVRPDEVLAPALLPTVQQVDFWLERRRRVSLVRSLSGLRIDVQGPGWAEALGDQPGAHWLAAGEPVPATEYAGVVNPSTLWPYGVNLRVFSSVAAGVPVITPDNPMLDDLGLDAEARVHRYDEVTGQARDVAEHLLQQPLREPWRPCSATVRRHDWADRAARILDTGAAPRPAGFRATTARWAAGPDG